MNYAEAADVLRSRFFLEFVILRPEIPIAWPNFRFIPPAQGAWVRFSLQPGEGKQVDIGAPEKRHRYTGIVAVQVFVPAGEGTQILNGLVNDIINIFRGFESSDLTCLTPSAENRGISGNAYQTNIIVPFWRDEIAGIAA